MNYKETVDFLFQQLPQFQKIGGKAYNGKLDNILSICKLLNNPHKDFRTIHVAGTNGKGSVCNMLASVLAESGYKVGLFTSPHLLDFRERIRINGEMIPESYVVDFVQNFQNIFTDIHPSFFEWSTALAFDYFRKEKVDIAIIETGLGGRLDSTNIIQPLVSVITSIGIDHTQYLGNTLEAIATEKGGIIKPNVPVIVGEGIEMLKVFEQISTENNSALYVSKHKEDQPKTSLAGDFQKNNVATTLKALELIINEFPLINEKSIESGLDKVQKNTGLRGRWETLQQRPKVICDIGHNVHGVSATMESLKNESYDKLHIIWGMVEDKEIEKVVHLLPNNAFYYLCSPKISRAINENDLIKHFNTKQNKKTFKSCPEAFTTSLTRAKKNDLILIGGSTFVVSEILEEFFK